RLCLKKKKKASQERWKHLSTQASLKKRNRTKQKQK
uniref:Uncharacterized protein n=1 Tax=Otolemur garnettii TaxID=30611 RepID=H0XK39_OTOGA